MRPIWGDFGGFSRCFHFSADSLKSPGIQLGTRKICAAGFPSPRLVFSLGDFRMQNSAPSGRARGENRAFWGVRAGNLSPAKSGNRAEVGRNSSVFRDSFDGDVCFAPGKSHVQSAFLHFERWAPAFQFRGHPGGFRGSGNVTYHMGVPWGGGCVAVGGPGAVFLRDSFYGGSHPGRKRPDRRN